MPVVLHITTVPHKPVPFLKWAHRFLEERWLGLRIAT